MLHLTLITMQRLTLLSSKVWYHLIAMDFSILRIYQQNPNKMMKNQGENENRSNKFYFHDFIHFIADVI